MPRCEIGDFKAARAQANCWLSNVTSADNKATPQLFLGRTYLTDGNTQQA